MENEYFTKIKYKECCDNTNKSGRSRIEFKWYNQLDEIFGKNKDAVAYNVSSQIGKQISKSVLSDQINNCASKSPSPAEITYVPTSPIASTSSSSSSLMNTNMEVIVHCRHGTGSNLVNRKINIEQQWLKFLENKEEIDTERDKRHAKSEERANESLIVKKQIIALKKKTDRTKKELLNKKLKDKENRHAEIIRIEKKNAVY